MQRTDVVTGWIEGVEPERAWRLMVAALVALFALGVMLGAVEARASASAPQRAGAVTARGSAA
ncbi:hypothetical protein FGE12_25215 [Aggregicoccus sp. 17bor-14]|uniref:hypothetical protein n=1 Tax=Myxococcaceae TaxID=31 RepID=UPI00129CF222|nr:MULTISPECIES: hypothetical protein [Myxococcaceae]MBF5045732.1 hypothetical protein [Simulacricoccus sp. 17bor-14]MRI91468.1 hypothetical protein [Aggregicoccus sp. 17bor-14]